MINIQSLKKIIRYIKIYGLFRTTKIWVDSKFKKYRHWPKNNGHKTAVLQPFNKGVKRSWSELKLSTRFMLFIENMVINKNTQKRFNI